MVVSYIDNKACQECLLLAVHFTTTNLLLVWAFRNLWRCTILRCRKWPKLMGSWALRGVLPGCLPGVGGGGCHNTSDVLPPTARIINGLICRAPSLPASGVNCHTTPGNSRPSSSVASAKAGIDRSHLLQPSWSRVCLCTCHTRYT
jgi:hypothetical protein